MAVFTGEYLDIHHNAVFAVRYTQGGITHFSRFFTEDGAQQAFFSGQFRFALGRYLTHQDIAGTHLGAHADNTAVVQVAAASLH